MNFIKELFIDWLILITILILISRGVYVTLDTYNVQNIDNEYIMIVGCSLLVGCVIYYTMNINI